MGTTTQLPVATPHAIHPALNARLTPTQSRDTPAVWQVRRTRAVWGIDMPAPTTFTTTAARASTTENMYASYSAFTPYARTKSAFSPYIGLAAIMYVTADSIDAEMRLAVDAPGSNASVCAAPTTANGSTFDTTRNRSRRFCSDSRCAGRTHTVERRARQRDE